MTSKFPNGSEWRKWDLHIHAPSRYTCAKNDQYEGKSLKDKQDNFLRELRELNNISVLGITDYFSLDGYKFVADHKNDLTNIILILPNIEFRISPVTGDNRKINLHLIANTQVLTVDEIERFLYKFEFGNNNLTCKSDDLVKLGREGDEGLSDEEAFKSGLNKFVITYEEFFKVLLNSPTSFQNNVIVGVSNNSQDGASGIKDVQSIRDIIYRGVDFIFSAQPSDIKYFLGKSSDSEEVIKKKYGNLKPCLHGSDFHGSKSGKKICVPDKNRFCWIKADPTFSGLKQVLNEPERVFIGEEPPIFKRIKDNKTKHIKSLFISNIEGYNGSQGEWFNNIEISFNSEMVAIIGNKGSGKSAISDILGLCGGYKSNENFSFLKQNKFNDRQGQLSKNFKAELTFHSGHVEPKVLNSFNTEDIIERVKYLPQGYFESITNDLEIENFRREIENVVFSHYKEKENYDSFQDLIERKKRKADKEIQLIKDELEETNKEIIKLEKKLNPSYKKEIEKKIILKKEEIDSLILPDEIKNPDSDDNSLANLQYLTINIEKIKDIIVELERKINEVTEEKNKVQNSIFKIQDVLDDIILKERAFISALNYGNSILEDYGLKFEVDLPLNKDSVLSFIEKENIRLIELKQLLEEDLEVDENDKSLVFKLNAEKRKLEEEQEKLDEPRKLYQNYLNQLKAIESQKRLLEGDEKTQNSLKYLEKEISFLENDLQNQINHKRRIRTEIVKKLIQSKFSVVQIYRDITQSIKKKIDQNQNLLKSYPIDIEAKIHFKSSFNNDFLNCINQKVAGTFQSLVGGDEKLSNFIKNTDLNQEESIVNFLNLVVESLFEDKREEAKSPKNRNLEDQVKDPEGFYDFLFSLDYLHYNYELMQGRKKLEQLSPGERGALLLIFFLLLDKDDKPIILDQPEDNLDNQSVANILVPFIKKAKNNRQIIIVTHNPNLAIVSDAEQVIYVKLDKEDNNKFSYISGSIENPKINYQIVTVLEGAMPAFKKRKDKYYE
jgi:ABC-type lipoprotein export system ATPase subunit